MTHLPKTIALSIIIPVHNEGRNIKLLYAELQGVLDSFADEVEVIFVDDGSRDETWHEIGQLLKIDHRLYAARIRCRRGKANALAAGFRLACGEHIVTMDGDLQDDPNEIPKLLQLAQQGFDIVCGWKQKRCDSWQVVAGSRIFNRIIGIVYGLKLHDHNCGLKCFKAEVVKDIRLFGQLHRFITVIAHCQGFRVTEIPVRHRPRKHGQSKYGVFKFVEGLLDLFAVRVITIFLERPFHLFGTIGMAITGLGFSGLAYLALYWILGFGPIGGRPLLIYSTVAVLFGMQLIALGITAELINWKLSEHQQHSLRKFSGNDWEPDFESPESLKSDIPTATNKADLNADNHYV